MPLCETVLEEGFQNIPGIVDFLMEHFKSPSFAFYYFYDGKKQLIVGVQEHSGLTIRTPGVSIGLTIDTALTSDDDSDDDELEARRQEERDGSPDGLCYDEWVQCQIAEGNVPSQAMFDSEVRRWRNVRQAARSCAPEE